MSLFDTTEYEAYLAWCEDRAATVPPDQFKAYVHDILEPVRGEVELVKSLPSLQGNLLSVGNRVVKWVRKHENPFLPVRQAIRNVKWTWPAKPTAPQP